MGLKRVVAGVLKKGNEFLIVRRPFGKKRGGLWEFPGGKVEEGETLEQALARELKEELDIRVTKSRFLDKVVWSYEDVDVEVNFFEVEFSGEVTLKEAEEGKWVSLREALRYDFCGADRVFLERLVKTKN